MSDGATDGRPRAPVPDRQTVTALTRTLSRALRAVGEAGRPVQASRWAAEAWALLRHTCPGDAERLNGVLHYLARLPDRPGAGGPRLSVPSDTAKETTMTTQDRVLDVRTEIPARRHELIFETWAALSPGAGFVLVNDHDPKPLYYQFAAEHAGQFAWDYLEQGPQTWRVRIGRVAAGASDGDA